MDDVPKTDAKLRQAFKLEDACLYSMEQAMSALPQLAAGVEPLLEKSKEIKEQQGRNGIGFGIIFAHVPKFNMVRLVPLGVEGPPSDLPPWNSEWKEELEFCLNKGMKF